MIRESLNPAEFIDDAHQALRSVRRNPKNFAFSAAIIGLGVGACAAVFSVLSPLLLTELPFLQPERLVWIAKNDHGEWSKATSRVINLRDFRALSQSFDGLTGFNAFFEERSYNLVGEGQPVRLVGVDVASDFLDVLGVQPALGRSFLELEGQQGGPQAAILSHAFWRQHFGQDRAVIGRSISLNDQPTEIVGVLPKSFDFASIFSPHTRVDFLRPFPISDQTDQQEGNTLTMIGRLKPAATGATAQADLDRVIRGLKEQDPNRWGLEAAVSGMQEKISRPYRSALMLLAAAAGAVLLIVCINLSNLQLARGGRRSAEMAVRRSLGASRFRLIRQLQLESLLLATGGVAVGLVVATAITGWVAQASGLDIPLLSSVHVGLSTILFAVMLALFAGLLVGVLPAFHFTRGGDSGLGEARRGTSSGRRGVRLRDGLVIAELALSCILLVFSGLLLRSFQQVLDVELGFQPEHVVAWPISSSRPFETVTEQANFYDSVAREVAEVPGVSSAGLSDAAPLGRNRSWMVGAPGYDYDGFRAIAAFPHLIDEGYLKTLEIPLIAGRQFMAADDETSKTVIMLNQSAAEQVFKGEPALGRQVFIGDEQCEVIGIVRDIRHRSLELGAGAEMYFSIAQVGNFRVLDLVVRSTRSAATLANEVAAAIHAVDPAIPASQFQPLQSAVDRSLSPRRFTLQLLVGFATTALLLAALGIYGVLSCTIAEQQPEIGIRIALGETRAGVLRRVLGQTLKLAALGLMLGVLGSILGSRFIASLLYDVKMSDPWTFFAIAAVLILVATVAGLVPAWRASKTHVSAVLRAG